MSANSVNMAGEVLDYSQEHDLDYDDDDDNYHYQKEYSVMLQNISSPTKRSKMMKQYGVVGNNESNKPSSSGSAVKLSEKLKKNLFLDIFGKTSSSAPSKVTDDSQIRKGMQRKFSKESSIETETTRESSSSLSSTVSSSGRGGNRKTIRRSSTSSSTNIRDSHERNQTRTNTRVASRRRESKVRSANIRKCSSAGELEFMDYEVKMNDCNHHYSHENDQVHNGEENIHPPPSSSVRRISSTGGIVSKQRRGGDKTTMTTSSTMPEKGSSRSDSRGGYIQRKSSHTSEKNIDMIPPSGKGKNELQQSSHTPRRSLSASCSSTRSFQSASSSSLTSTSTSNKNEKKKKQGMRLPISVSKFFQGGNTNTSSRITDIAPTKQTSSIPKKSRSFGELEDSFRDHYHGQQEQKKNVSSYIEENEGEKSAIGNIRKQRSTSIPRGRNKQEEMATDSAVTTSTSYSFSSTELTGAFHQVKPMTTTTLPPTRRRSSTASNTCSMAPPPHGPVSGTSVTSSNINIPIGRRKSRIRSNTSVDVESGVDTSFPPPPLPRTGGVAASTASAAPPRAPRPYYRRTSSSNDLQRSTQQQEDKKEQPSSRRNLFQKAFSLYGKGSFTDRNVSSINQNSNGHNINIKQSNVEEGPGKNNQKKNEDHRPSSQRFSTEDFLNLVISVELDPNEIENDVARKKQQEQKLLERKQKEEEEREQAIEIAKIKYRIEEVEYQKQADLRQLRVDFEEQKKYMETNIRRAFLEKFGPQYNFLNVGPDGLLKIDKTLQDLEIQEKNNQMEIQKLKEEQQELEATMRELERDMENLMEENDALEEDNKAHYETFKVLSNYATQETLKNKQLVETLDKLKSIYEGSIALMTAEKTKTIYRSCMYKCAGGVQYSDRFDFELFGDVMTYITETEDELGCEVHDLNCLEELEQQNVNIQNEARKKYSISSSLLEAVSEVEEEDDDDETTQADQSIVYDVDQKNTSRDNNGFEETEENDREIDDCSSVLLDITSKAAAAEEETQITTLYENKEMLYTIFKLLDKDGSGDIDVTEFQVGIALLNRRLPDVALFKNDTARLFKILDVDGKGRIDLDQFKIIFNVNSDF